MDESSNTEAINNWEEGKHVLVRLCWIRTASPKCWSHGSEHLAKWASKGGTRDSSNQTPLQDILLGVFFDYSAPDTMAPLALPSPLFPILRRLSLPAKTRFSIYMENDHLLWFSVLLWAFHHHLGCYFTERQSGFLMVTVSTTAQINQVGPFPRVPRQAVSLRECTTVESPSLIHSNISQFFKRLRNAKYCTLNRIPNPES